MMAPLTLVREPAIWFWGGLVDMDKASYASQSMGDDESVNQSMDQSSNGFTIFHLNWAQFSTGLSTRTFFLILLVAGCCYWSGRRQRVSRSRHQQLLDAVKRQIKVKQSSGSLNKCRQPWRAAPPLGNKVVSTTRGYLGRCDAATQDTALDGLTDATEVDQLRSPTRVSPNEPSVTSQTESQRSSTRTIPSGPLPKRELRGQTALPRQLVPTAPGSTQSNIDSPHVGTISIRTDHT